MSEFLRRPTALLGLASSLALAPGEAPGRSPDLDPGPTAAPAASVAAPADTAPGRAAPEVPPVLGSEGGWWTRSYLVDYAVVAGGTAGYVVGRRLPPRSDPLWGPSYDPGDLVPLFQSADVGRRFRDRGGEVTVPRSWIHYLIAGAGVFVTGVEGAHLARGTGSPRRAHDTVVGYLETVALTAAATALTKPFVGRLRPDFGDRARRYHCHAEPDGLGEICAADIDPLSDDPVEADDLLDDGRRSFFSGHASHSFNLFGYAGLVVGGRYVWGDGATTRSRLAGVAGQAGMLGAAGWISESRISDGRHHRSDVVVGTLVGLGFANVSYWRRFHRDGSLRGAPPDPGETALDLRPWISPRGAGVALELRH